MQNKQNTIHQKINNSIDINEKSEAIGITKWHVDCKTPVKLTDGCHVHLTSRSIQETQGLAVIHITILDFFSLINSNMKTSLTLICFLYFIPIELFNKVWVWSKICIWISPSPNYFLMIKWNMQLYR